MMGRLSRKPELNHTSSMIKFFLHAILNFRQKFKCNQHNVYQQDPLKAHFLSDRFKLLLFHQIVTSHYIFNITYQPQTFHLNNHTWKSIVKSTEIYNDEEFLDHFWAIYGAFLTLNLSKTVHICKAEIHRRSHNILHLSLIYWQYKKFWCWRKSGFSKKVTWQLRYFKRKCFKICWLMCQCHCNPAWWVLTLTISLREARN